MTSVSTHILDTSSGRPAAGVAVELAARPAPEAPWTPHGASATDADGRCKDLPALPADTAHVRLRFAVGPYFRDPREPSGGGRDPLPAAAADRHGAPGPDADGVFFPEVTVVFAVTPGEHYHVPLLLNPFGYSVYRGS
ncbi:hydroxyisourate hydrolase [Actinacidiphila sp. ITFR-21]|uniref:hydroxyisourate hydrolase n=1 Tax=Actinacidiphila sp. ITFR-21 TaxID=3075199 RepID=UPI0028894258|nr:hydroxyisourate hydrolase [Streptomyces sp. ITFR-21]WNI18560.1 hydroxyisourate hydrolase [Streptomyces sp. ITFR-21]